MATKQFNSRIQWKKDTSANWTSNNPVLLNGEIAIVVTNSGETRFKIGDGTSSYTALPFQDEAVRALITAADNKIDAHIADTDNPHEVTKAQIGLSNVDNVKQYSSSNPPPYPVTSVNSKTGAVSLTASEVGARPDTWVPTLGNLGITATASELNKLDGATVTTQEINYLDGVSSSIQTQLNGKVPKSRTVNNKALSSNITLSAADVDAVPTSRTVNGKPLSSNVTLSASDVGALSTAGGTMTGTLTLSGNPSANLQAATKQYVDTAIAGIDIPESAQKYSGTLPTSGWTTSGSQRYYQVSISGMTADKTILAIPQWSNQTNQQDSWNNLVNIRSYAGYVRFYASAAPSASINYTLIYY